MGEFEEFGGCQDAGGVSLKFWGEVRVEVRIGGAYTLSNSWITLLNFSWMSQTLEMVN